MNKANFTSLIMTVLIVSTIVSGSAQIDAPPVFSLSIQMKLSNLIGSDGTDWAQNVIADNQGNLIVTINLGYPTRFTGTGPPSFYPGPYYGDPNFHEFLITEDAYDKTFNYGSDIILLKMDQQGNIIFSTYFGGEGSDVVTAVTVDSEDNIFLTGYTTSTDFPLLNAYNSTGPEIQTGFISEFASNGSLLMSTYFGGSYITYISDIILDGEKNIYITGSTKSEDFPELNPAFQNIKLGIFTPASFIAKFNSTMDLQFSTLIGGSDIDDDYTMSYWNGIITLFGLTKSSDFPITENAPNKVFNGYIDAFITRFNATTGAAEISTFVGGTLLDWISSSVIDHEGNLIVTGYSNSKDYPVDGEDKQLNNGFGLSSDAILTKLAPNGTIIWSTFLGGTSSDRGIDIVVDSENNIILAGETSSTDFPVWGISDTNIKLNRGEVYKTGTPPKDIFISKFIPDGRLAWSVLYGSKGDDTFNSAYLINNNQLVFVGYTADKESFPHTNTYDPRALDDAFVGIMEIPDTPVSIVDQYYGYNYVSNQQQSNILDFLDDPISIIVLSGVGLAIVFSIVNRAGLIDRFRRKQDNEWKQGIKGYYDKIRSLDEKQPE